MRRLFEEAHVTHDGKYYACRDIEMAFPGPKQKPFAPLDRRAQIENVERAGGSHPACLPEAGALAHGRSSPSSLSASNF